MTLSEVFKQASDRQRLKDLVWRIYQDHALVLEATKVLSNLLPAPVSDATAQPTPHSTIWRCINPRCIQGTNIESAVLHCRETGHAVKFLNSNKGE